MRTKRKSKRKQRHVWRWAIGVLVLAVLVTAGWAYWYLEPGRHFETSDLPILAQPHTPQTDEGAGKDGSEKETVPTTTPDSSTSTPASSTKPQ
ncbi:MAG TPA: hypothetical protein VFV52_14425, partial [Bacilli bacterium]|nr:hypothetical protein [Bacilli bacterium]